MPVATANKEVITVKEAMRRLSCSRSTIYRLCGNDALRSVHIRGSRRICLDSVNDAAVGGVK